MSANEPKVPYTAPKAVVFDIGRVLYQWNLSALFEKLIANREERDWFLANVVTEEWHFQTDAGRKVAEVVAERKAEFPDYGALIDLYNERFLETLHAPVDGTHALVERLSAQGTPLYALSNFGAEFWARFRPVSPIFDHFTAFVISGEEKCVKPHAPIYEILESRVPHATQELFFIDDRADNIEAAKSRGWHGHVFTDAENLEASLKEQGFLA